MPAFLTTFAVQEVLKEMRDGSGTIPSSFHAALFTTTPGLDGLGGVEVSSVTHSWYSRKNLAFGAPSGRTMANSAAASYTTDSPTVIASPLLSMGLYDDPSAGNLWVVLLMTTSLSVGLHSIVNFPIGQIVMEFPSS